MLISSYKRRNTIYSKERGLICWLCRILVETKDPDSGRSMPYMMMVSGEGMPSRGNPFVKGNLYVAFHIDFPKTLGKSVTAKLRDLLPDANMEESYDADEVEEHFMVEADL